MALPTDEWLAKAQALSVGQTRRTYHNEENRANLVIGNEVDKWWCYCHRCHEGGTVLKQHVQYGTVVEQQARFMPWPDDAKPLGADPGVHRAVHRMLLPKGIDLGTMLPGVPVMTSASQGRLLVGSGQGWLGRAIGNVQPKWCAYHGQQGTPVYATHPADTIGERVLLTEDYFSALKVRWATNAQGIVPVACLGTTLSQRLLGTLLNTAEVYIAFDGDRAGWEAWPRAARRLRGLGKRVRICDVPAGLDPKDMQAHQIQEMLCAAR